MVSALGAYGSVWFVLTARDGAVHHCAGGKWYESRSRKLFSMGLQLRHSASFPKGSAVGKSKNGPKSTVEALGWSPGYSPSPWYSLFRTVPGCPLLSQSRRDPDDSLIAFAGS